MTPLLKEAIVHHLANRRWRPGWTLTVCEDPWEGLFVRFVGPVQDSYDPENTIDIGFPAWLPPMLTTEQLDYWVQWRLNRQESHEGREFYMSRCANRPVFDPHAE
jgi:hypothetical protein